MMDAGAEQHQGSHLKITGTADESEMSNAKVTTGSHEQIDTLKPQSELHVESPIKEITEPDQQFEPAQPCLTTISKSSGMEANLTAEDPDVLKRKEPQGETGYKPETEQKGRGVDQELDRRQEPESDTNQEQKSSETQEQESYRRPGQESENGQEHESDQRQEQKFDERQNQQFYQGQEQKTEQTQDVESVQQNEGDSEPRGYSDSGSSTQLHPQQHKKKKSEDHYADNDTDKTKYKIFVIGKTGSGKSSLCNKIIGRNAFATGRSFKQVTTETQEETTTLSGLNITVVDTPDISDKSETIQKDTVKRWRDSAKGYDYMVVLAVRCDARYSPAEYEVYRQIKQLWGHDLWRKLVVAFTFGDTREDQSKDIREELEEVWQELKHVIKDANNRFVVFNNEPGNTDEYPVKELVEIMKRLEDGPLWKWVASGITVTLSAGFVGFVFGYAIYKIVYYPLGVCVSLMDIFKKEKKN